MSVNRNGKPNQNGGMERMKTRRLKIVVVSLALSLTACGLEDDYFVNPDRNPELFMGENSILGDWVLETDLPYSHYLRVDGASGYSCYNDGKTNSSSVELFNREGAVYLRSVVGPDYARIEFDAKNDRLSLESEEKGTRWVRHYRRGLRPNVCQRVENGEDVDFHDLKDSWRPTGE